MAQYSVHINGVRRSVECDPSMPLLWVLRDLLGLTGTKYGCGIGACGACTVHLDGAPVRACLVPVSTCAKRAVTTIEGLSRDGNHPVQRAWRAENVPQCGYCQAGQLMTAAALLSENPSPSAEEINQHMSSVLCRCGTYPRIRRAVAAAAASKK